MSKNLPFHLVLNRFSTVHICRPRSRQAPTSSSQPDLYRGQSQLPRCCSEPILACQARDDGARTNKPVLLMHMDSEVARAKEDGASENNHPTALRPEVGTIAKNIPDGDPGPGGLKNADLRGFLMCCRVLSHSCRRAGADSGLPRCRARTRSALPRLRPNLEDRDHMANEDPRHLLYAVDLSHSAARGR